MSETHRITFDPGQCGGRPCLRGLRIRVKDVLDLLAADASRDEILKDYPLLEPAEHYRRAGIRSTAERSPGAARRPMR